MKESVWGYAILVLGIVAVGIIWFFANTTKTDQHNYTLLKETTEAAMFDALDLAAYRQDGTIRIEEEKFVENFIRRFAENADLSSTYKIEIYDVNEEPPKVSLRISSSDDTNAAASLPNGEVIEYNIVNNIDAILETKYYEEEEEENSYLYKSGYRYFVCRGYGYPINVNQTITLPTNAKGATVEIIRGYPTELSRNVKGTVDGRKIKWNFTCNGSGVLRVYYRIKYSI